MAKIVSKKADKEKKYVAYIGTYTHGSSVGIHIYDVDLKERSLTERSVVPVHNSSYLTKSRSGQYLYSIADEGVDGDGGEEVRAHGDGSGHAVVGSDASAAGDDGGGNDGASSKDHLFHLRVTFLIGGFV